MTPNWLTEMLRVYEELARVQNQMRDNMELSIVPPFRLPPQAGNPPPRGGI